MTKIFKTPFATQGDRVEVPDEPQADGSVSYNQGYGYDYERDQTTDPAAKDIEREKMNGIFHDITEATGEMQQFGVANWNEAGKPYPVRAMVYYAQKIWQSKIANNSATPVAGAAWQELKADLTPADIGAYTKVESDQRFQPLGNYAPPGDYVTTPVMNQALQSKLDKTQNLADLANKTAALQNLGVINAIYPVGIVTWFAQNKNPNTLFPGTVWKYVSGAGRTVRIAAENGSDINTTGGADSVTLTANNIPLHAHSFSGSTGSFDYGTKATTSFDYGTKTTSTGGAHTHAYTANRQQSGGSTWIDVFTAQNNQGNQVKTIPSGGAHNHTVALGAHAHNVVLGAHTHTFSGTTTNTGGGVGVNVTNSFVKLMAWYRES